MKNVQIDLSSLINSFHLNFLFLPFFLSFFLYRCTYLKLSYSMDSEVTPPGFSRSAVGMCLKLDPVLPLVGGRLPFLGGRTGHLGWTTSSTQ